MKCKICNKRFRPTSKMRYLATENIAPLSALTTARKIYECFDCPRCGCQNSVNIRMPEYEGETDDSEENEEETEQQAERRTV